MATEQFNTGLIAEKLRGAVESAAFERVPALAEAYGTAISDAVRGAGSFEDGIEIAGQACSFLEERLHLARVMRAHISAQMAEVCRLASYRSSPSIDSTWFVNG